MMRSTIRSATCAARAGSGGGDQRRDGGLLRLLVLLVVGDELGTERLRQFGTVAIERIGLQGEAPGQHIGVLAILDRRIVRHVDRLRDRAGDEGLRGGEHADMALDREIALAGAPARAGAIEHLIMLDLEMRRALQASWRRRYGCSPPRSRLSNSRGRSSRSKLGSSSFSAGTFSVPVRKSAPSVHLLKTNLMSKAPASDCCSAAIFSSVKPRAFKRRDG